MTMLRHTNSSVAVNKMRSDLSLRAIPIKSSSISPETSHGTELGSSLALSGQQSSVGHGLRHQLPRPGQPGFPAANPPPRQPTDDCSLLSAFTKPSACSPPL